MVKLRDVIKLNRDAVKSISDELGIPEEKVSTLIDRLIENPKFQKALVGRIVKEPWFYDALADRVAKDEKLRDRVLDRISDFYGRRSFLEALALGAGITIGSMGLAKGEVLISNDNVIIKDPSTGLDWDLRVPLPFSAIVGIEGKKVRSYNWRGRLIDEGEEGVYDAKIINSAIDFVGQQGGGKVVIKAGKYYVSNLVRVPYLDPATFGNHYAVFVLNNLDGIKIISDGATIIPNFTPPSDAKKIHFIACGMCRNISIHGIKINGSALPSPYPTDGYNAISIHGGERIEITKNAIELTDTNVTSTAIAMVSFDPVGDIRDIWVYNNILKSNVADTIAGGSNPPYVAENIFVYNNIVTQLADYPHNAFDLVKLSNVFISENRMYGLLTLGVEQLPHTTNIICENIIEPSPNGTKTNITISSSSENPSSDIIVTNNIVKSGFVSVSGYSKRIIIKGNIISGGINEHLICLGTSIQNILIEGNILYMPSTHTAGGIVASDQVIDVDIISNIIHTEVARTPIYIYSGDARIINNRIEGIFNYGVRLYYDAKAEIYNNLLKDGTTGISIEGQSSAIIVCNKFYSVATPIFIATSASAKIKHNIGYPTENQGIATITGNGTTTTFTVDVTHGLVTDDPTKIAVTITPSKACDVDYDFVDTDGDGFAETLRITLTFGTAPANGEVVYISWRAEVVS